MATVLALALVGFFIWYFVFYRRGRVVTFTSTAAPRRIAMSTIATVGRRRFWNVQAQMEGHTILSYERKADPLAAIILLLLFIVPGLVYLVAGGEHETVTITTDDAEGDLTFVQITANGPRGNKVARILQRELGPPPAPASPATLTPAPSDGPVLALEAATPAPTSPLGPYGR